MAMYAFGATSEDTYEDIYKSEVEKLSKLTTLNDKLEEISAFTAQMKQLYENTKWDIGIVMLTKMKTPITDGS